MHILSLKSSLKIIMDLKPRVTSVQTTHKQPFVENKWYKNNHYDLYQSSLSTDFRLLLLKRNIAYHIQIMY